MAIVDGPDEEQPVAPHREGGKGEGKQHFRPTQHRLHLVPLAPCQSEHHQQGA